MNEAPAHIAQSVLLTEMKVVVDPCGQGRYYDEDSSLIRLSTAISRLLL
jgi:hypothetical protein